MTRSPQEDARLAALRDAVLEVWGGDGGNFKARYTVYDEAGEKESSESVIDLGFDRATLEKLLASVVAGLTEAAEKNLWSELKDPMAAPATDGARARYRALLGAVASAGSGLHRLLSKIPEFGDFLKRVEALPDGARLTVETEGAVIPWEILYPLPFNKNSRSPKAVDWTKFWGCRFELEHQILRKGTTTDWKVGPHQRAKAYVSLNLNKQIEVELSKGAFPSQYKPIAEHRKFYESRLKGRGSCSEEADEIKTAVLSASEATVIYLYCHGKSADAKSGELLEVGPQAYIEPDTVGVEDYTYPSGPILILNSCSSGLYSPLSLNSFYSEFKDKRAIGVIGTMMPMPATFAAAFGIRLIDDYVNYDGDRPPHIGAVLRNLRVELVKFDNPLGLLYVLQCPLHATARRA